jgi:N-acetylglucosamine-6-sulfatase
MRRVIALLASVALAVVLAAVCLATGVWLTVGNRTGVNQPASAQTATRPNILFVMTDDLALRDMNRLGSIKNVFQNGLAFQKAFVTTAHCCPSRASLLTGRYVHNHGIKRADNLGGGEAQFRSSGLDRSTVATWLQSAGYDTMIIGKYLNGYKDTYVPPGWTEWYVPIGKGPILNENGTKVDYTADPRYYEDLLGDITVDFIERHAQATDKPFFAYYNTHAPHSPFEPAAKYQGYFENVAMPRSPSFNEADVSDKPKWVREMPRHTETQIQRYSSIYKRRLEMMLSVRDNLNEIIAALQRTGELGNTYIFFTSDNGYHIGEHRLGNQKLTNYEEDIRVPLYVRGPGVPAGTRAQMVLNTDFAPTLAKIAGATPSSEVDGTSFVPLLGSTPPASWRKRFMAEAYRVNIPTPSGPKPYPMPENHAVRNQNSFYNKLATGEREWYNLERDPYELNNRARYMSSELRSRQETLWRNLASCHGDACRRAEFAP